MLELSLYVAVAANWVVLPTLTWLGLGVIATDTNDGGVLVTVSVAEPCTAPDVALIVAAPTATAVASPPWLTVAVVFADDVQVALLVRFAVLPSE